MTAISDITAFQWPSDCNAQGAAMLQFLRLVDTLMTSWESQLHAILQLNQATPPSEGDWESAWIREGNTLPIPDGTRLLWFDTTDFVFGGLYLVSLGEIVRSENAYYPGKVVLIPWYIQDIDVFKSSGWVTTAGVLVDMKNPLLLRPMRSANVYMKFMMLPTLTGAPASSIAMRFNYRLNGGAMVDVAVSADSLIITAGFNDGATAAPVPMLFRRRHTSILSAGSYLFEFFMSNSFQAYPQILGLAARKRLPAYATALVNDFAWYFNPVNIPGGLTYIPAIICWELVYST